MEFFTETSVDTDDKRWKSEGSFYISIKTEMEVSFHDGSIGVANNLMESPFIKELFGEIPSYVKDT